VKVKAADRVTGDQRELSGLPTTATLSPVKSRRGGGAGAWTVTTKLCCADSGATEPPLPLSVTVSVIV